MADGFYVDPVDPMPGLGAMFEGAKGLMGSAVGTKLRERDLSLKRDLFKLIQSGDQEAIMSFVASNPQSLQYLKEYRDTVVEQRAAIKPTANIQDYEYYRELLKTSPEEAQKFALQVGITDRPEREIKPTVAMQNFEKYKAMPDGPEKSAFGRMIGIDPKKTAAAQAKEIERQEGLVEEIDNAETTIGMADSLLGNQGYIDAITGFRGATPFSVPGGTGFDAMVAFDQLKNSLTLDNLSKMSGVLSDSDIKILRSAGAGLEPGMSEEAMRRRLNKVIEILNKKVTKNKAKITPEAETIEPTTAGVGNEPVVKSQEQYDSLPSGAIFIEDGKKYRKP